MPGSPAAALLFAAGSGALPALPCGDSGHPYVPCRAAWEHVGPATLAESGAAAAARRRRGGGAGRHRRRDDDDDDDGGRRGKRSARDIDDDDDADMFGLEDSLEGTRTTAGNAPGDSSAAQVAVESRAGVWLVGSVNGGVWRSRDIHAARPHWDNVLDGQPVRCSAISALAVYPEDRDHVLAGCGPSTSGEMGNDWQTLNTGDWGGVMESLDGGDTWAMLGAFPVNYYVTGFAFPASGRLAVSAFSNFFNRTDGGVWLSDDNGATFSRSLRQQVFGLLFDNKTATLLASVANDASSSVWASSNLGDSWHSWSKGVKWHTGHLTFYTCLAVNSDGVVFLGGFARSQADLGETSSEVFWRRLGSADAWQKVKGRPMNLDQDKMPKDRMGLLSDPTDPATLYVNGNAGAVAWRVDWSAGEWTSLYKYTEPHGDCRNFAWEAQKGALILLSDGGIFLRNNPKGKGKWRPVNGDITTMEMLTAAWDGRLSRWVAGAQDNSVQLSPPNATGASQSVAIIGGDGTEALVDNRHRPSRLYGSSPGLGGLGFYEGEGKSANAVTLPLSKLISGPDYLIYPFYQQPLTLNTQDPSRVFLWARGHDARPSAFYSIAVPQGATSPDDITQVTEEAGSYGGDVYAIVAGGFTNGTSDPSVLVGANGTTLYYRSAATAGRVELRALPSVYAEPRTCGPCPNRPASHGKTVSLAVSPADSRVVAVTGWPSTERNDIAESLWLSRDAGGTWGDAFGNLAAAVATVGRVRPAGLLLIDFPELGTSALLTGTVAGPFVSWTDRPGTWARLGRCVDLPLVMVMELQYEHYSDTLVAASYGRGVYVLHGAKAALLAARAQQRGGSCAAAPGGAAPASSARFFPPQM